EINVQLLILGTVERTHGGLADTAGRRRCAAEENELSVVVAPAHPWKQLRPGRLRRIEDERDELNLVVLRWRLRDWGDFAAGRRGVVTKLRHEIASENQAQHEQDDDAADPHRRHPAAKATLPAPILDIRALSARLPSHSELPRCW